MGERRVIYGVHPGAEVGPKHETSEEKIRNAGRVRVGRRRIREQPRHQLEKGLERQPVAGLEEGRDGRKQGEHRPSRRAHRDGQKEKRVVRMEGGGSSGRGRRS